MTAPNHLPVMVREVVEGLGVRPGGRYVDATVGLGGHAVAIMEAASPGGALLGIDRDAQALESARERLAAYGDDVRLVQGDFSEMDRICSDVSFAPVHGVLMDLGVSSLQLDVRRDAGDDCRWHRQQQLRARADRHPPSLRRGAERAAHRAPHHRTKTTTFDDRTG
jgi:16S rRNA (cytosine1402-N4)-methyltransferase